MSKIAERFFSHVDRSGGDDACWEWTSTINHGGYGIFSLYKKNMRAHRFSAAYHGNPIPVGFVTDHLCRNRKCVNPRHLEAVTHLENVRRGEVKPPPPKPKGCAPVPNANPGWRRDLTHCKHGHPFDEENTQLIKGGRKCKTCRRLNDRKYREKRRAKALAQETQSPQIATD